MINVKEFANRAGIDVRQSHDAWLSGDRCPEEKLAAFAHAVAEQCAKEVLWYVHEPDASYVNGEDFTLPNSALRHAAARIRAQFPHPTETQPE